jgi:hypothetical protein
MWTTTPEDHDVSIHSSHSVWAGVRHAASQVREGVCACRGHELVLSVSGHRMFLRCLNCGYETHGWTVGLDHERRS